MDAPSPVETLKKYWGYDAFRPLQEDIVKSILAGKDTLALLPTGGGKSVCFQVPAMMLDGICLVISPLIALMKDQAENLRKRGVPTLTLFSGMTYHEINSTLEQAAYGKFKFLYCSPERLQTEVFKDWLPELKISFIAVDEAHCIAQWGYEFRPAYMQIADLKIHRPNLKFLALTASATPEVQQDICTQLKFKEVNTFKKSFARPNLSYSVVEADSRIHKLIEIVQKVKGSAIVYCKSRRRCQEIAELLQQHLQSADFYHAGLPQVVRNERQEKWINNEIRIIVCTNAFGMGIDKPDVRLVVHADCPDSLEHYYQEAGRAGRDGKKAFAVLLRSPLQAAELLVMPDIRYPTIDTIRKIYQALGDYFQIPAGTGDGKFYDFDLSEFVKRFKLNALETTYSIQALEQEEIISYNEQIFIPSKVQVICSRELLQEWEIKHPKEDTIIKSLLRSYSGIWDQPTSIYEFQLAKTLRVNENELKEGLRFLHQSGVIHYQPKKETPQICYLLPRTKAAELYISPERYGKRKKAYQKRIEAMASYLESKGKCRTKIICSYFGDDVKADCEICDYCVREKNQNVDQTSFEQISQQIKTVVQSGAYLPQEILTQLSGFPKEKINLVLQHLIQEGNFIVKDNGKVFFK
jgi:ATP-dependent DNA helicase RecQ